MRIIIFNHPHIEDLEKYYAAQAEWTRATRNFLYRRTNLLRADKILEVGCGTGEITAELMLRTKASVTAVDIDKEAVECTSRKCPEAEVIRADASRMGFLDETFDAAICHFTLMWCREPELVVSEMARVVRRSSYVLALAEPDYGGLVEFPEAAGSGRLISEGLRGLGADPDVGRKVRRIFRKAGLETEVGLASAVWSADELKTNIEAHRWLIKDSIRRDDYGKIISNQDSALERDDMIFFLPVFWVCGLRK